MHSVSLTPVARKTEERFSLSSVAVQSLILLRHIPLPFNSPFNPSFPSAQDFALDLHTQSTGIDYPIYVFADYRNPKVHLIAENLYPEMIKIDAGEGVHVFGVCAKTFRSELWPMYTIDRTADGFRAAALSLCVRSSVQNGGLLCTWAVPCRARLCCTVPVVLGCLDRP